MVDDYQEDSANVVWNFDDKQNQLIFQLKLNFLFHLESWDLEKAYWQLLLLLTESETLFEEKIREDLNNDFNVITEQRTEFNSNKNQPDNTKSKYFLSLNTLYRKICLEIVSEGLYFRKKKAYMGL